MLLFTSRSSVLRKPIVVLIIVRIFMYIIVHFLSYYMYNNVHLLKQTTNGKRPTKEYENHLG